MHDEVHHLLTLIRGSARVLLTGPEGPDGDSLGACLALQRTLRAAAPGVQVVVVGDAPHRYRFLPGAGAMVSDAEAPEADGVVILDGDRRRLLAPVATRFGEARWTGLIDHHRSTDPSLYSVAVFDPACESTCAMVHAMARAWGVAMDVELATLLYCGVIFDTGGFRYSNTKPSTHRLAAELIETGIDHATVMAKVLVERRVPALRLLAGLLSDAELLAGGRVALATCARARLDAVGAVDADIEGVVDHLQHTEGVELAAVLIERADGRIKVSLRSRGGVDVSLVAKALHDGGGGHAKAAGVVLAGTMDEVAARIREALQGAVS